MTANQKKSDEKHEKKSEEEWPARWPLRPIPTKPTCRPYFKGEFVLHVWPDVFKIPREDKKPFYFRLKNPTQKTVRWYVHRYGSLHMKGPNIGTLEPSEISEPIGIYRDWDVIKFFEEYPDTDYENRDESEAYEVHVECGTTGQKAEEWAEFWPRVYFDPPMDRFEKKDFEYWTPVKNKCPCVIM